MNRRSTALALLGVLATACGDPPAISATVATAELVRGELIVHGHARDERVETWTRVEARDDVSTGAAGRGAVTLDSGAWVFFDHATRATVDLARLSLTRGRVWVDATGVDEMTVATPHGAVSTTTATFAVELGDRNTSVYCASGELTYRSRGGSDRMVQGERVVLGGESPPELQGAELWDDWTGGLADPARSYTRSVTPLGSLSGRRLDQRGRARTSLPIRNHEVDVTIRGDLAATEVVQTFFNARSETLEGEWSLLLPHGAIVQSFAVDRGQGFEDAAVGAIALRPGYRVEWGRQDTSEARLTYDGPGRLRARIFPMAAGATVRVRIRYTQWLARRSGRRTYHYPMRAEADGPALGEFLMTVETEHAQAGRIRAGMGATVEDGRAVLRRSDFRPRADFYLDLYDAEDSDADAARAYVVNSPRNGPGGDGAAEGSQSYVLLDIPSQSIRTPDPEGPLELVLLLDTSGETGDENLAIARGVVEAVLRQVTPSDRIAIRLADVSAYPPEGAPDGLVSATPEHREAILASLTHLRTGGASDLGRSLREAAMLVAGRPRGAVLYLGDGLPTTGGLDASSLRAELGALDSPPRFFGLAIGEGSNAGLLARIFDGNAQQVIETSQATRVVMRMLAQAATPSLRHVEIELGEGIERSYPRTPLVVPRGDRVRVTGRLVGALPTTVTLRGSYGDEAFEETITVSNREVFDQGDIRRRWAEARLVELIDQSAGREALVELGTRFGLVSPWTAMVVSHDGASSVGPVRGFDHDPTAVAWAVGGGAPTFSMDELASGTRGWRRRARRSADVPAVAPERTWSSRVAVGPVDGSDAMRAETDGGLARIAVTRALRDGGRGPRACFERRTLLRPDLQGHITLAVTVRGDGSLAEVEQVDSTVGDTVLERCVRDEIAELHFPDTGGRRDVRVIHPIRFSPRHREFGGRRSCSNASRESLAVRRRLWAERLELNPSADRAILQWRSAEAACELPTWTAKRTLLHLILARFDDPSAHVALHRGLEHEPATSRYLRRLILRRARTPDEVAALRMALGMEAAVDWAVFSNRWKSTTDPTLRLRLVRRWLAVLPEEIDLRLRLLALLEETGARDEARRLAEQLQADVLADARVRSEVGEFWLREGNEAAARRAFSELVERTPLDPWARRRLGDLYRAHGWFDDAYREYRSLARLQPSDESVLLLLARAAASAGRIDEALRLERRLIESSTSQDGSGAATAARLWTSVHLARLLTDAGDDASMVERVRRRQRATGALREPAGLLVVMSWEHPDDRIELTFRRPGEPSSNEADPVTLGGSGFGILALREREREEGEYLFEARRVGADPRRVAEAELLVVTDLGHANQRVERQTLRLIREDIAIRFRVTDGRITVVSQTSQPSNHG